VRIHVASVDRTTRPSDEDLAVGLRIIADLVESGLPLGSALRTFGSVAPTVWRPAVPAIEAGIREGKGLAGALSDCGLILPALVIGLLRTGDAGSGLAIALRRAAEFSEVAAETRAAIRSALAYPAVVVTVGLAALGMMVGIVMPQFAATLEGVGGALPPLTRGVLEATGFLRVFALPACAALIAATLAMQHALVDVTARRALERHLLRVPLLGAVRKAAATARFTAALGALLESGATLRAALRDAQGTLGDSELNARLDETRRRMDAGQKLAHALEQTGALGEIAVRLVAAGEESGRLPQMLDFAARLERARAERLTRTAVRLIEPLLIVGLALAVAVVAAAMLQAVYAVRP
jgi:general secretion pathway protein F